MEVILGLFSGSLVSVAVSIVVLFLLVKIAFFTIKKVFMNVLTAGILYYVLQNFFSPNPWDMGLLSWILTAPLGPIPVLVNWFMA